MWPRILHDFQLRCQLLSTRGRSGIHTLGEFRQRIRSIRSTDQGRIIAFIDPSLHSIASFVDQSVRHLQVRHGRIDDEVHVGDRFQNMESVHGLVQEYSGEESHSSIEGIDG
jgi:hypothetical protein